MRSGALIAPSRTIGPTESWRFKQADNTGQMPRLPAVRHGLRSIGHLIPWVLLFGFACATQPIPRVHAISGREGTASFGLLGPPRNDLTTAFNDVVAICNANNFCCQNNGTETCGTGFSCVNYAPQRTGDDLGP